MERPAERRETRMGRDDDPWQRWAAGAGIGFVVLALIAFLFDPSPPKPGDPAGEIASHFRDNDARVLWQAFIFGLASVLYLWFFGTLATYLRVEIGGVAGRYSAIVLGGAATSTALFLLGTTASASLASRADDIADETAAAVFAIGNTATAFTDFPAAVVVGAVSLAALRTAVFPDWLAWAGAAVDALLLITAFAGLVSDAAAFDASGWFAILTFLAFLAWTALTSWLLVERVGGVPIGRRGAPAA